MRRRSAITFFSTAFDIPSADFLAELDMPAYKIASGDTHQHSAAAPCREARQADDHLARRLHDGGRGAGLSRDHADQPAALHPAMHLGLSGRVRRAEPEGHPDFPRTLPRHGDRPVLPRQRHRHGAGGLCDGRTRGREAFHAEPRCQGHRPRLLARRRKVCAAWCATCAALALRWATA